MLRYFAAHLRKACVDQRLGTKFQVFLKAARGFHAQEGTGSADKQRQESTRHGRHDLQKTLEVEPVGLR